MGTGIKLTWIVIGLFWFFGYQSQTEKTFPEHSGKQLIKSLETDSISYELFITRNDQGIPESYYAEIFTPVCYSDKCYPVFIDFHWDLLGNFMRFEIPTGKSLTKNDHVEFDRDDYQKMHEILSNESSMLKDFEPEDLVVDAGKEIPQGVDAVTGATLKTLQNEVISGAVYSCYTLWHIAHGDISGFVREHTEKIHNQDLIIRFLESQNHRYQYWAIEKVMEENNYRKGKYVEPMLEILRGKNIFIANNLLDQLPLEIFESEKRQLWLWETFQQSPYRLQMAILDKLKGMEIHGSLHQPLIEKLEISNAEQKKKIFSLLASQTHLTNSAQKSLLTYLLDDRWQDEVVGIYTNQKNLEKTVKQQVNYIENEKNKTNQNNNSNEE